MAVTLLRSTLELQRLTNLQWSIGRSSIDAYLADISAASTPPTSASAFSAWEPYLITEDPEFGGFPITTFVSPSNSTYNSGNQRAEVPELVFTFNSSNLGLLAGSTTVTNVVFVDTATSHVIAVGQESPARIITPSSSFNYRLNLWGKYAA